MSEAQWGKVNIAATMEKACRVKFSTKPHTKRKGFCRKKITEDLADVQTVNNVNNDIDLSVNSMDSGVINSSVNSMNNIDSSVNSTDYDILNIVDVSTASERKILDINSWLVQF